MSRRCDRRQASSHAALIAAYREGLGLAAIAVMRDTSDTVRIDALANGASPPDGEIEALWWCRRVIDAARVAAAATARLRRSAAKDDGAAIEAGRPIGVKAVEAAARQCGVTLHSDAEVSAAAMAAIARVDCQLERLRQAGELKSVNRSYRIYREQAAVRGERVLPYVRWFNKYREKLVRELAAALRYG